MPTMRSCNRRRPTYRYCWITFSQSSATFDERLVKYYEYIEETLELFKCGLEAVPIIHEMSFKELKALRDARIKRLEAENKRQEEERKKLEKERIKNKILSK